MFGFAVHMFMHLCCSLLFLYEFRSLIDVWIHFSCYILLIDYTNSLRCTVVTCTYMYILVHTCTYLYILIHTCTYLYILVHTCTYLYILVHTWPNMSTIIPHMQFELAINPCFIKIFCVALHSVIIKYISFQSIPSNTNKVTKANTTLFCTKVLTLVLCYKHYRNSFVLRMIHYNLGELNIFHYVLSCVNFLIV